MTPNQQPARSLLILSTRAFPFYIPLLSKPAPPTSAPGLGSKLWSTSTVQRQQVPALCSSPTFNPGLPAPPNMGGTVFEPQDLKNRHKPLKRSRTRGTTEFNSGLMALTTSHFSQNLECGMGVSQVAHPWTKTDSKHQAEEQTGSTQNWSLSRLLSSRRDSYHEQGWQHFRMTGENALVCTFGLQN